jgi:hypothetical protein
MTGSPNVCCMTTFAAASIADQLDIRG